MFFLLFHSCTCSTDVREQAVYCEEIYLGLYVHIYVRIGGKLLMIMVTITNQRYVKVGPLFTTIPKS